MPSIANEQDILNDIINRDLKFEPGSKFEYSDLGFILLKNIIEKTNRSNFKSRFKMGVKSFKNAQYLLQS